MKSTSLKYLKAVALLLGATFLTSTVQAQAGFQLDGDTGGASAFVETTDAMNQIITLVFYVLYAVGAIMMGVSGFKLKGGDIPGFVKMFLGGAALFVSPLVVRSLQSLGAGG